jgi:DNA-binding transcriptional ArsR family regulator
MAARTPPSETHSPGLAAHRALAHPLRLRILRLVRAEPTSASALARELDVLPGSARFHLGVLERAGIVTRSGERVVRGGREVLYSAPPVLRIDDVVAPEVRAQSDRAYLHELSRLIELGATQPDGTAGFSLEVQHLTPEGAEEAEHVLIEAGRRIAALDRREDPDARPHVVATQLVALPPGEATA